MSTSELHEKDEKELWHEYQHWHTEHNISISNLETLEGITDYELYIHECGSKGKAKKRIRQLIADNDRMVKRTTKRMTELEDALQKKGISITAFHCEAEKSKKMTDYEKESIRKCNEILDNRATRSFTLGACEHDHEDEDDGEVDVLDCDPLSDCDLEPGVGKINYFNDKNDAEECEDPYKCSDIAIRVGKSMVQSNFAFTLKPHQREAVFLCLKQFTGDERHGVLLSHAMGLGKTLTTICVLQAMQTCFTKAKFLIVCPKTLEKPWYAELQKWQQYLTIPYYQPTNDLMMMNKWNEKGGILIMGSTCFKNTHVHKFLFNPDILVVDEAHILKNKETELYKAVESIGTSRKLLLTGTPVPNRLEEYGTLLDMIHPGFTEKNNFKEEYADPINKGSLADANPEDILEAKTKIQILTLLTKQFVHRRSVEVLRHALPPITDLKATYVLPKDARPDTKDMGILEHISAISSAALPTKLELLVKIIEESRKIGDCTLIFSKYAKVVNEVSERLKCLNLTGQDGKEKREATIESFKNGTGGTELCMTTTVGGAGLNLPEANRVIILDPDWNPTVDTQACFRVYRIGQLKAVTILRFICFESIEDRIYKRACHKTSAACRIVSEADVERLFTKEQLYNDDECQEDVLTLSQIKDPVVQTVFENFYSFSERDLLFAEAKHEKLTAKELADAYNTFNGMVSMSAYRIITHPISKVQHTVPKNAIFFPNGDDDALTLVTPVTPATPTWKETSAGFQIGEFIPSHAHIDKYITELEMSASGRITTRQEEVYRNKAVNVKISSKGICRIRIKIVCYGQESEWSDWSALMHS